MWQTALIFLACAIFTIALEYDSDPYIDIPNIQIKPLKTSADRIREHGYPAETHVLETSDGYLLTLFRIPYSHKLNNEIEKKPVVYLQHGLFSNSDCFLLNGPDNAIAYLMADAGFDVWLGNARGNIYSRNNSRIHVNHPKFWDFSWHEIAVIDLAEAIDYILDHTGEKSLHYTGHSQGGTAYFVLLCHRPEYNAKIRTGHNLAPAVFMGNSTHPLVLLFWKYVSVPGLGSELMESMEFAPHNRFIQRYLDGACGGTPAYPKFCKLLFLTWGGPETVNTNTTLLSQIAETHPAGISSNQGIHYCQEYQSGKFRQMDFGPKRNLKKYGQETPPEYDLGNISADTYVYYGLNDTSVNWRDIELLPGFVKLKELYKVPDETWGHIDFIFAWKVKEEVNDRVINHMKTWEKEHSSL